MHCFIFLFIFIQTIILHAQNIFPDCQSGPLATFPICDQSLSIHGRAMDLIDRMTIQEKANWSSHKVSPIPRLGLPPYVWWNEALHGVVYLKHHDPDIPNPTSFPAPINLAATFNMNLLSSVANLISTEARAANNENITGLNFFTPNINTVRDPRWGRGQETPGEDPFLASQYASTMVRGLQEGEDNRYLKVAATCKHFIAYDLENWNGTTRWTFDAEISDQDLVETYLPPFEACIRDGQVKSIMGSLNAFNGIPACAHQFLFQTLARLDKIFFLDNEILIYSIEIEIHFTSMVLLYAIVVAFEISSPGIIIHRLMQIQSLQLYMLVLISIVATIIVPIFHWH